MGCRRVRNQLSAYVDGELTARAAGEVATHLDRCSQCTEEVVAVRRLRRLALSVPQEEVPDRLHHRIMLRLAQAEADRLAPPARRARVGTGPLLWTMLTGATVATAALTLGFVHRSRETARENRSTVAAARTAPCPDAPAKTAVPTAPNAPVAVSHREASKASAVSAPREVPESAPPTMAPAECAVDAAAVALGENPPRTRHTVPRAERMKAPAPSSPCESPSVDDETPAVPGDPAMLVPAMAVMAAMQGEQGPGATVAEPAGPGETAPRMAGMMAGMMNPTPEPERLPSEEAEGVQRLRILLEGGGAPTPPLGSSRSKSL